MEVEPRHTKKIQQTVGRPPIAEGVNNLRLCPPSYARYVSGGQVARDKNPVRIGDNSHTPSEVEVVATVDACPIDLRVAQPAHFGVHKIFPAPKEIGLLPGSAEPA
jgi:hypothetical protein